MNRKQRLKVESSNGVIVKLRNLRVVVYRGLPITARLWCAIKAKSFCLFMWVQLLLMVIITSTCIFKKSVGHNAIGMNYLPEYNT